MEDIADIKAPAHKVGGDVGHSVDSGVGSGPGYGAFILLATLLIVIFAFKVGLGTYGEPVRAGASYAPASNVLDTPGAEVKAGLNAGLNSRSALRFLTGRAMDVNTASAPELTLLPGIGDKLSRRIVALRDKRGGFSDTAELMEVSGIGTKKFKAIRPYVAVGIGK